MPSQETNFSLHMICTRIHPRHIRAPGSLWRVHSQKAALLKNQAKQTLLAAREGGLEIWISIQVSGLHIKSMEDAPALIESITFTK